MQKYIDVVQTKTGTAVSGATVYIYATGTTNLSTIYSDDGITPKANPMTTDSSGEFSFYAADGDYDIRVVYGSTDVTKSDISLLAYDADLTTWAGITPGTGVATALGTNVGSAGSFVTNGGVLGTPSSGTVTNLTGTASININGTVGATTPATGAFTTLSASGGGSLTGTWTNLGSVTTIDINGGTIDGTNIGATTPGTGAFTTLSTTGNVTLGDASTDTVTVNGYMGVGGAPLSYRKVYVAGSITGAANSAGVFSDVSAQSDVTGTAIALYGRINTAATAFTVSDAMAVQAANAGKGAGSTITNQHGVYINDQTQGTNNYGITSLVSSGANKWNIYASGTADNYFAGNVGIGVTPTSRNNTTLQIKDGIGFPATQSASSDANTLDDYREATFTATATGMTTSPTGTATFVRAGNKITLDIPTISGTSNAVTFTLTGMPTTCRPSATRTIPVRVQDNGGAIAWGMAQIDSAGVITLYKDAASGAFTGSGTKSINTCSVAYVI